MAYSEKVMDHFQHPRNVGEIENASGVGTVGNAKCGDIMRIFLDIDDETHIIKDCKFKTFGCGAAVATSSMATEMVMGKTIEEAMEVTNKAVMEALDGLPPVKVHCSLLAEEAIHAALWDYAQKHHIEIKGLKKPKSDINFSFCNPLLHLFICKSCHFYLLQKIFIAASYNKNCGNCFTKYLLSLVSYNAII